MRRPSLATAVGFVLGVCLVLGAIGLAYLPWKREVTHGPYRVWVDCGSSARPLDAAVPAPTSEGYVELGGEYGAECSELHQAGIQAFYTFSTLGAGALLWSFRRRHRTV